jgi:hypothetical protein
MSDMTLPMPDDKLERLARRRAGAKLGWFIHASVYLLVNAMLYAISSEGWGHRHWSLGPVLGWGIGLLLHGFSVFVLGGSLRERMVQRELENLRSRQGRH